MFTFKTKNLFSSFKFLSKKLKAKSVFKKSNILDNDEGMAVLETIPLLVVFMVLMTYAIGFWGTIHSSILNSIAARTYAFETFRNRSNLLQFRETEAADYYKNRSFRLHTIIDEKADGFESFIATRRPISFSNFQTKNLDQQDDHSAITDPGDGRGPSSYQSKHGVSPIWIQIGYGYCLDLVCREREL